MSGQAQGTFPMEAFLRDLETIVNIDSCSDDPAGVAGVAAFFRRGFEALGWHSREIRADEKTGPLLEIFNKTPEHYDILFCGHMDTVFPAGTVEERPFSVREGFAYGPGVADMKQGDLSMLYTARLLSEEILDRVSIGMLLTPDEEISSRYSRKTLMEIGRKADRILVMEACLLNGDACIERSGKWAFRMAFSGIPAHAGFIFERENASAVEEMAHWILLLASLKNAKKGTTVNIAPVSGGTAQNVVAESASLECEIRFREQTETDRVRAVVAKALETPFVKGAHAEITEQDLKPAWVPSEETKQFAETVKRLAAGLGQDFHWSRRGGLSDANTFAQVCPCVIDGMGPRGQNGHSPLECLDISSIEPCIRLNLALLKHLAEEKK